jgi:hypothetical protein
MTTTNRRNAHPSTNLLFHPCSEGLAIFSRRIWYHSIS